MTQVSRLLIWLLLVTPSSSPATPTTKSPPLESPPKATTSTLKPRTESSPAPASRRSVPTTLLIPAWRPLLLIRTSLHGRASLFHDIPRTFQCVYLVPLGMDGLLSCWAEACPFLGRDAPVYVNFDAVDDSGGARWEASALLSSLLSPPGSLMVHRGTSSAAIVRRERLLMLVRVAPSATSSPVLIGVESSASSSAPSHVTI